MFIYHARLESLMFVYRDRFVYRYIGISVRSAEPEETDLRLVINIMLRHGGGSVGARALLSGGRSVGVALPQWKRNVTSTPDGRYVLMVAYISNEILTARSSAKHKAKTYRPSAKSGSKFTLDDLSEAFLNIVVKTVKPEDFFLKGTDLSSIPIDPALLADLESRNSPTGSDANNFLNSLLRAAHTRQESAIDVFVIDILKVTGYHEFPTIFTDVRHFFPLYNCGKHKHAETDFYLGRLLSSSKPDSTTLLVAESKTTRNRSNPVPQLVAEALAVHQSNNKMRKARGLEAIDIVFPCFTMVGTRPTFYLIPITRVLMDAVGRGVQATGTTEVLECEVDAPGEGMEVVEYRERALQSFIAFRSLAKSYWQEYALSDATKAPKCEVDVPGKEMEVVGCGKHALQCYIAFKALVKCCWEEFVR
jgi:hypothetical protein